MAMYNLHKHLLMRLLLMVLLLSTSIADDTTGSTATIREALDDTTIRDAVELWFGNLRDRAVVLNLYGPMPEWDVSQVTSLAGLFRGNTQFHEDLSQWDTSSVTDMSDTFSGCSNFVSFSLPWNTSSVQTMTRMFRSASLFNGDLSAFDMSSVKDISFMFHRATMFEGKGLATWNTSAVYYANDAFSRATNFNADISKWDTSNVISFQNTFRQAVSFNQDLSFWDVGNAMTFHNTFKGALNLRQTLCWPTLTITTSTTISRGGRVAMDNLLCDSPVQLDPCCVDAAVLEETCCDTDGCPDMLTSTDHCNSTAINTAAPTIMDTTTLRPSPLPEDEGEEEYFTMAASTISPTVSPEDTSSPTVALDDANSTAANDKTNPHDNADYWYGTPNDIPPEEEILLEQDNDEEDADTIHEEEPHYESASAMPNAGTDAITTTEDMSLPSSGTAGNTQLTSQSNQRPSQEQPNNQNNVWILTGSILGGFLLVVIVILTISWMRQGQDGDHQTTGYFSRDEVVTQRDPNLIMSTSQSDMMTPLEGRGTEMPVDW